MPEGTDDRSGRAVFLDRDGVLNRTILRSGKRTSPRTLDEVEVMAGAERGCSSLRAAGYVLVMVTNQPEIARGIQRPESLGEINRWLSERLWIHSVKVCPHDDQDECDCRKPKPGMILEAAEELRIDLRQSYLVGDRWRDVEAGRRAGCRTVLITGDGEETVEPTPDFTAASLAEASEWILGEVGR
ncbi:MAG: HAD family hydrolase [Acidobacteriales bacterium]|nr:HAD family hydrolase [Terriglobales bacterium]